MPRTRAPGRIADIIDAAISLFMRRGYAATRLEMIAAEAGVAAGTLYLYADGKDALFELALRSAFLEPPPKEEALPHRIENRTSVIEAAWQLVRERARFPRLERAATLPRIDDVPDEFTGIVTEFYDWLALYWRGVRIVEKCALEWPELSTFFYRELRRSGLQLMEQYLEDRAREGSLRTMPDAAIAARIVLETVSFFAMHRHTAPDSESLASPATRETVVAVLHAAFVPAEA
jgi:AcrR family transcriptional regulator